MDFILKIGNFGNIEKANIHIKPFTIIAGENGTGKSFITKGLYCLLDCLNKNYISENIGLYRKIITREFGLLRNELLHMKNPAAVDREFFEKLGEMVNLLGDIHLDLDEALLSTQGILVQQYIDQLEGDRKNISLYLEKRSKINRINKVLERVQNISQLFGRVIIVFKDIKKFVADSINNNLSDGFKKNFQITNLNGLIKDDSESAELEIDTIGTMKITEKEKIYFNFKQSGIDEVRGLSSVIFLDSPIYLKIKKGLQSESLSRQASFIRKLKDEYLSGYPQYIDILYSYFSEEFIGTPFFREESDKLKEMIDGGFEITSSGDIQYSTDKKSYPLSLVATGVSNIGILERLARNNTITKGSFLFIDEPEVHLHPKWQVGLVYILYEMAKKGANIVIATHSLDMIKAVEILLKKNQEASDLISLNRMPYMEADQEKPEIEKVGGILSDLSSPFYDLYMEGLS